MRPPRVLIVSNRSEIVGGGEISMLHLLEGLLLTGVAEPVLAVPGTGGVLERAEGMGVPVVEIALPRIRTRPWSIPRLRRDAARVIRESGAELVHANGTRAMLVAGVAAVGAGLPAVWHVRVEGTDRLDPYLARRSSWIIVPSETVSERFPSGKVKVVPNPVPMPVAGREDERIRELRASFAGESEFLLLAVGEIIPRKAYPRILEALASLETGRPWRLLIAGRENPRHTDLLKRLEEDASEAGIRDRVHFLGFREDVEELMLASDLLIHAPDSEGFGRVFIEAMAAGLPLVSTPVGGLKELHRQTGYGWLAEDLTARSLARAIEEALENKDVWQEFSRNGPEIAHSRFSLRAHAISILNIYRGLLGEET